MHGMFLPPEAYEGYMIDCATGRALSMAEWAEHCLQRGRVANARRTVDSLTASGRRRAFIAQAKADGQRMVEREAARERLRRTFPCHADEVGAVTQAIQDAIAGQVSRQIAFHEAGHTVALVACGGELRGAWATSDSGETRAQIDTVWPAAASVAGRVAAQHAGYPSATDSDTDLRNVTNLRMARAEAGVVVVRHWAAVCATATHLQRHGWLDATTARTLLAPFGLTV